MVMTHPLYAEDVRQVAAADMPWDKLNGRRVLLTGANGLIGSFLADCLMCRNAVYGDGIRLHALCRDPRKAQARFSSYAAKDTFFLLYQDVCSPLPCTLPFDYIIHAASPAHPAAFAAYPVDTIQANILGCVNLLEHARTYPPTRFLFVSSGEVYGHNRSGLGAGVKENESGFLDCAAPRAAYPESKRLGETLCVAYHEQYGTDAVIARPCYVYGPTMTDESAKADAQFIRNAISGGDIVMKSPGTQLRSYCYVSDMVKGLLTVLLAGESAQAYNIANRDCAITIRAFAETLADIAGVGVVTQDAEAAERDGCSPVANAVQDAGKLEALGFTATVGLREGLDRTIKILGGHHG